MEWGKKSETKTEGLDLEELKPELVSMVKKLYNKDQVRALQEKYIRAISEENIDILKELSEKIENKLDYDRKHLGLESEERVYREERGYSWYELESARKKLLVWIETKK